MAVFPPRYCGMPLDRGNSLRQDPDWIRQQLDASHARVLPLWRNHNLFTRSSSDGSPQPGFIDRVLADTIFELASDLIYLGHHRDTPYIAADLTHLEHHEVHPSLPLEKDEIEFMDLRLVAASLQGEHAATLAYARGIAYWHRQNRFCGRCGSATTSEHGGHMRRCRNDECGRNIFPRIDPAVIMLVEQQNPDDGIPRCLLGRHHKLPQRIYSTLAGYVETGENLEEAVAREIREEAGISVSRVSYLGSQPWPFPSAMMVGFLASSPDREIVIAEDELEDARWFSAEEVRGFGEFDDAGSTRALPRKDSIARLLIQTWLDRVSVQDN